MTVDDMSFDMTTFDLSECTELSLKHFDEIEYAQALPDPQPFVRFKNPPINYATEVRQFVIACKAATGREIAANEAANWKISDDERHDSAVRIAHLFSF